MSSFNIGIIRKDFDRVRSLIQWIRIFSKLVIKLRWIECEKNLLFQKESIE